MRHRFWIHHNSTILTIKSGLILISGSLLIGALGYILIEDYTAMEAFYMAIITISTVGFSEVRPLSDTGRLFTSLYVMLNLGITALFISQLTQYLSEGGIIQRLRKNIMEQHIARLQDHTILCGAGRYGREILEQLEDSKEEVLVIEKDMDMIRIAIDRHPDLLYIHADATFDEILIKAGIEKAKSIIVTLNQDSDIAFVVLSARQLAPGIKIIARVYEPESKAKLQRVGADHVIQPEQIGSYFMAALVRKPAMVELFTSIGNKESSPIGFEEIPYPRLPDHLKKRSLKEMNLRSLTGASVVALRHSDGRFEVNPDPEGILPSDSSLIALGSQAQIDALRALLI